MGKGEAVNLETMIVADTRGPFKLFLCALLFLG